MTVTDSLPNRFAFGLQTCQYLSTGRQPEKDRELMKTGMYERYAVRVLNKEYEIYTDFAGLDIVPAKPEPLEGLGHELFKAVFDYFEDMNSRDLRAALRDLNVEVLEVLPAEGN
jgi:hypothetical protein